MLLATAIPNKKYVYYNNLKRIVIEARKNGSQLRFYEVSADKEKCLPLSIIRQLFLPGTLIKYQPFLKKENKEFCKLLK